MIETALQIAPWWWWAIYIGGFFGLLVFMALQDRRVGKIINRK